MGVTFVPVDPRGPRREPCRRPHVSAVAYVRAGLFVGFVAGLLFGYVLARVWG